MPRRWPRNEALFWARTWAGLSQEELARQVNVSRQTISDLERLGRRPTLSVALALGRRLGRSVEELFG